MRYCGTADLRATGASVGCATSTNLSFKPDDTSTSFFAVTITPSTSGSRSIERHPVVRAEDEHAGRQSVGEQRAVGDDRHAAAAARRLAGRGIEDVVVADAVLDEEPRVVA